MAMPDEARNPTSEHSAGGPASLYANHLEISFGLSEVELCFAQGFDAHGRTQPTCRVRTTPVHLIGFGQAITRTIARYQDRFGCIPDADDSGGLPQGRA